MLGLKLNKEVVERCVRALKSMAELQGRSRQRLIRDTLAVCSTCDDAYSALLDRLIPIKKAFRSPSRLADELVALAGDSKMRKRFKPEGLCSEIDQLLVDFQSHLNGLRYSVHVLSISEIRDALRSMGSYDQALYHQYDSLMSQIGAIGSELAVARGEDRKQLVSQARAAVSGLETDLKESVIAMRRAKDTIRGLM